ncbi:putative nuclear protein [Paecilomyces variotii]|uniref:rRNA-processing protein EFG1 n=1 Tax=Byssochlamys spectabilis TaxID=264951 RepID=A0A443I155_BYSSP|nr:putative nuclear protein [Paecilomyces variotii]KAJ9224599.1 hypothetical protein DTO169C6_3148 [Paecilomyces variotii]KAJ9247888.1 hypothetical protein DTO207G8_7781 [Paecilomyces variotii]KAJ9265906.1 hypothetical protein DTO195F2_1508 [Paecilomyces variotii]KAJ9291832.1 hypothetical protein DTO021C3_733 [Paecilomyces variotii]KAJ9321425.1 hypothetical protein DTO027B3_7584 [Paecilomyces variotii]
MASKRKDRELSEDAPPAKKSHLSKSHGVSKKGAPTPRKDRVVLSVNELKRRIRDVKRLLDRVDLPPEGRITQERALIGYQRDLESEMAKRKRSEMIKKYHFVRFLERKTATKELKKLQRREREISESDSPTKKEDLKLLASRIHTARVNLNYTIYSPLTEKYISLYPDKKKKNKDRDSGNDANSDSDSQKGDKRSRSESQQPQEYTIQTNDSGEKPPLWYVVEKCMADGTLDLLREGKLNIGADGKESTTVTELASANRSVPTQKPSKEEKQKKEKSKTEKIRADSRKTSQRGGESDEDSDGGFFEE